MDHLSQHNQLCSQSDQHRINAENAMKAGDYATAAREHILYAQTQCSLANGIDHGKFYCYEYAAKAYEAADDFVHAAECYRKAHNDYQWANSWKPSHYSESILRMEKLTEEQRLAKNAHPIENVAKYSKDDEIAQNIKRLTEELEDQKRILAEKTTLRAKKIALQVTNDALDAEEANLRRQLEEVRQQMSM